MDHFNNQANERNSQLLRDLPSALHGFIALETFLDFVEDIPWIKIVLDREPELIRDLCRNINVKTVTQNNFLFTEGYEGIYYLEKGILSIDGKIYTA